MTRFRKIKSTEAQEKLIELLNQHVVDLTDLYIQTKLAHWNVRGPRFIAYHEFFDDIAGDLPELIDSLAEQASSLGGTAGQPVQGIASKTSLPEWPMNTTKDIDVMETLTKHWAHVANSIRDAIETSGDLDEQTSDLFTDVSHTLDKSRWFLEPHLTNEI